MSDQDRISPHNIHTISSGQVMIIKRDINKGVISRSSNKILRTKIIVTVPQLVNRITNEILEVRELIETNFVK